MAFRVCSEAAVKNCEAQPNDPHNEVPPIVSKSCLWRGFAASDDKDSTIKKV